jgi:hypothetical protein
VTQQHGQQHEQQRAAAVEPLQDRPDDERHAPRFLQEVHEERRRDEDEIDVEVGGRALGDVPGRKSESGHQRAAQRRAEHRQLGGDSKGPHHHVHGQHRRQDDAGLREHAHGSAPICRTGS